MTDHEGPLDDESARLRALLSGASMQAGAGDAASALGSVRSRAHRRQLTRVATAGFAAVGLVAAAVVVG